MSSWYAPLPMRNHFGIIGFALASAYSEAPHFSNSYSRCAVRSECLGHMHLWIVVVVVSNQQLVPVDRFRVSNLFLFGAGFIFAGLPL